MTYTRPPVPSYIVPSRALQTLEKWAREKQADTDIPTSERDLWKQIADEIETYSTTPHYKQDTLG
jgi:hypothetical protein